MLRIDGAAEELERVVEAIQGLDVLDFGAAADRREGQAVELRVRGGGVTGKLDPDVLEATTVVRVVGAVAVILGRVVLARVRALEGYRSGPVDDPVADDDQPAPVAR